MMNRLFIAVVFFAFVGCNSKRDVVVLSKNEKNEIRKVIKKELEKGVEATRIKYIDLYMGQMPDDFVIFDESGEIITREKQKENTLRDWKIIDTTLERV